MAAELNDIISIEFILQTNTRTIGRSENLRHFNGESYDFIPAKSEGMGGLFRPLCKVFTNFTKTRLNLTTYMY